MALPLRYDISVAGQDKLKRAMRGVVAEAKAASKQADAALAKPPPRRRGPRGGGPFDEIAKAAKLQNAEDMRRHRLVMRHRQRERNAALTGLAEVGRAAKAAEASRHREAIRNAKTEQAAKVRAEKAAALARSRAATSAVRGVGRTMAGTGRKLVGIGGSALAIGGAIGGIAATGALQETIAVRAGASKLANQAGNPAIKEQLAKESMSVSGFTGTEVLAGLEEFTAKTGDLNTARQIIGDLGRLSLATGADLSDLGATAGQAFNVIADQISNPAERVKELNRIMGVLAQQGALGAVEIRDLARDFGKLGAATRGFEGGAPELLRTMGAFAQVAVARGGAEGSADASTAATRLASDIVTNRKKFKKLGVGIKSENDPTKLRAPMEIMLDVLQKTGGDIEKTSGLFGMESRKVFRGFAPVFTEAEKRKKGSGREAVMAEFQKFAGAIVSPQEIEKRAKSREEDPDVQLKNTVKDFNEAVGTKLLPVVTKELVPALVKLTPHVADAAKAAAEFAGWFSENPLAGIGSVIASVVALDVAKARIGSVLQSGLTSVFSRLMPTVAPSIAATAATAGAGALPGAAAGAGGFMAATVAGRAVGAAGALGAGLAAAGGVALAYGQHEALKQETGGLGAGDILGGMWSQGTWNPFDVVDAHQNQQAMLDASKRATTPDAAPMDASATRSTQSLEGFGAALDRAQAKLDKLDVTVTARRNDPIIARQP